MEPEIQNPDSLKSDLKVLPIHSDSLENAWSLILSSYMNRCKDMGHINGFSMFSFREKVSYVPDAKNASKKFNCIYRFINKGSYFWNSFLDLEHKIFEHYDKTKNYMVCITLPPFSGGRLDEIISIKLFDNITCKEITDY